MARPQRPEPRKLTVIESKRVTPNMHRVTLGGNEFSNFPPHKDGGYIKLRLPTLEGMKPIVRTYTIRHQHKDCIDVDFALHGGADEDSGPATRWALSAKIGDGILVGGPGPAKPLPEGNGPFLLVGDMTALPAISVNLENSPDEAIGHVVILIRHEDDKQDLKVPAGVSVEWLIEFDLGANPSLLINTVRKWPHIDTLKYAWIACEFEAMKQLRQYLRSEKQLTKDQLYISSYWKRGLQEDEHKQMKRVDAEAVS